MSSVQLRGLAAGELLDVNGNALNGTPVWVYARGTTDQVAVFADSGMTVPLAQPLVTGTNTAAGAIPGYVSSPQSIDVVNGNTADLVQAEVVSSSDLTGLGLSVGGVWSASQTYQLDKVVTFGGYPYASLTTTTGNQPDVSPVQWIRLVTPPVTQKALGNMGAAQTVDFGSIQDNYIEITGTLSANCVVTLSNRAAGCKLLLLFAQDGAGSRTLAISDGGASAAVQVPTQALATFSIDVECPNATDVYVLPASSGPLPSSVVTLTALGSLAIGSAQLATTATDGFIYLPSCAGTPTGAPTTQTGSHAVVYDATAHKLWVYDSGWKGVVLS